MKKVENNIRGLGPAILGGVGMISATGMAMMEAFTASTRSCWSGWPG